MLEKILSSALSNACATASLTSSALCRPGTRNGVVQFHFHGQARQFGRIAQHGTNVRLPGHPLQ